MKTKTEIKLEKEIEEGIKFCKERGYTGTSYQYLDLVAGKRAILQAIQEMTKKIEEIKEIFEKSLNDLDKELRTNVIEFETKDKVFCVKDVKVMHEKIEKIKKTFQEFLGK